MRTRIPGVQRRRRPTGRLPDGAVAAPAVPWQLEFVALAFIWGSSFFLMKIGLRALAPLQISGLRIFSGAAVLLVLLRITRGRLPRAGRVWGHLMVASFFSCTLPFSLFALGEERVTSALAGIGNATTPIASVLFGLLLLPGERLPRRKLVAVVVGFVGVLVIMQPWAGQGRPDPVGFGMTVLAGASYGLGWTVNKRYLGGTDRGRMSLPAAQLVVAAGQMVVVLLVWWLIQAGRLPTPWSLPSPSHAPVLWPVLSVLALGVVGTGLAFSLQFDVMRAAGPTVATSVTYLIPVVSIALGVLALDEVLRWPQVLGAAIVLAAAVLIGRSAGRRRGRQRRLSRRLS